MGNLFKNITNTIFKMNYNLYVFRDKDSQIITLKNAFQNARVSITKRKIITFESAI